MTRHADIAILLICSIGHYFVLTSALLGPSSSYLAFVLPSLLPLILSVATGGTRRLSQRPYFTAQELPRRKVLIMLAVLVVVAYGLAFFDGIHCGEAYSELVFGKIACAERSMSLRLIQRLALLYSGHALFIQLIGLLRRASAEGDGEREAL